MRLWTKLVNWFENGDLMPPIILVSVPHYAHVLSGYDWWPVAAVVGFLVDISHYRTIKSYLKDHGKFWMIILTVMSFGFHFGFYFMGGAGLASIFFAAAVPIVIFALSFISKNERLGEKARKEAEKWEIKAEPKAEVPVVSGEVPAISAPKRRFVSLTTEERKQLPGMSSAQIASVYGITDRAARDWRKIVSVDSQ